MSEIMTESGAWIFQFGEKPINVNQSLFKNIMCIKYIHLKIWFLHESSLCK